MQTELAADAPFDYAIFRILPENRYAASVCSNKEEETIGHGPLDQLLEHLPSIKDQIAKGSSDNFKLELPNTVNYTAWFTKATLKRFLQIIGASDLKKCIALSCELSQLEETRKFHLSLYTKADWNTSTDTSKNELLQAMDSRLAVLTVELISAFNAAAGTPIVSFQEILVLEKFSVHFGDVSIRTLLSKLLEKSKKSQTVCPLDKSKLPSPRVSLDDYVKKSGGSIQVSAQSNAVKPLKYSASPAKAAELERLSSSDSEESSFSSESDQPPVERSRTLLRSASPRRSASLMRKIQIGRSGIRRTPALSIKSLPFFPSRDRVSTHQDCENDYDLEGPDEPVKKTEVNVTRLSVQDAISMFEKKQKVDGVDSQPKLLNDISSNTNKAVLRRWSSGMGESQKSLNQNTAENTFLENKADSTEEYTVKQPEVNPNTDNVSESDDIIRADTESERRNSESALIIDEVCSVSETAVVDEKLDSVEWSRQKEEELNKMLLKFAQYNISNPKKVELDIDKNRNSRSSQRTGLNGHQKRSKEEKPKWESTGKKAEKQTEVKAKKKVLGIAKTEKSSAQVSDVGRKQNPRRGSNVNTTVRTLNVSKTSSVTSNLKKELPKLDVLKGALPKSSPLPATRKSWPSTPLPRASERVATKTSTGPPSASSVSRKKSQSPAPRQKPQLPASVPRSSPRVERSETQQKIVKKPQVDVKKNLRKDDNQKSHLHSKSGKTIKSKTSVVPVEEDVSPVITAVRKKVTNKSSVAPLEVKLSSIEISGVTCGSNLSINKREIPSQAEQQGSQCDDPVKTPENVGPLVPENVCLTDEIQASESQSDHYVLEMEIGRGKPDSEEKQVISTEASTESDDPAEMQLVSPVEIQPAQEPVIPPAAWEENNQQDQTIPVGNSSSPSPVNHDAVASSGTRVRYSLSQMLLEESSEPDIIEWGNAEQPPSMIYPKDVPKGFKKLLKFARKNRGDANGPAWASQNTSEGEDDSEEYKSLGKRHSENLLKVALHSKNCGEGFLSDSEPLSARSNVSNNSTRSAGKFQDGYSSKGTRSFFSLSAFRKKS